MSFKTDQLASEQDVFPLASWNKKDHHGQLLVYVQLDTESFCF